jgi:hypothetical protein
MLSEISPNLVLYTERSTPQLMLNMYDTHSARCLFIHSWPGERGVSSHHLFQQRQNGYFARRSKAGNFALTSRLFVSIYGLYTSLFIILSACLAIISSSFFLFSSSYSSFSFANSGCLEALSCIQNFHNYYFFIFLNVRTLFFPVWTSVLYPV